MVAMAVVLNFFKFDLFAQGGSMNLLFIPLMVFALRRGPVWGMGAGLVFGVLKAIIGGGIAYGWQSLLAARNILGENHDVWTVNVERSYHEEFEVAKKPQPGQALAAE